jgi:sterol desaturase/sphingolipid hydroxylase (fatty acid hydroxylase superfamily)
MLMLLVPIHIGALFVVLTVMSLMGVTNHMGWELFPAWLVHGRAGAWLITASHHHRHHLNYGGNYGLYFRLWDRLCGTDLGLAPFDRRGGAGTAGGGAGVRDRGDPAGAA